ncbi:DUF1592 domain-containing protein [Kolteria novifilia]|uniref:DUF1592 domain-containing protein n=1 Tax=Kolteria novifilia TaxID=2527975 RepID=UPI003AF392AC
MASCLPSLCLAAEPFDKAIQPFLATHCLACHDETTQEGDFRIDTLSRDFQKQDGAQRWAEVIERINSGEMPPEDEVQPTETEIAAVVGWLGDRIKEGKHARMAKRAPVAHYRLSREEYSNTIHDLLGVHYDAAAPGHMTEDPVWHGFERIGSQLTLSPSHVEKYLRAAREVLDNAYPEKPPKSKQYRKDALDIDWPNRTKRELLRERGILDQVRVLLWPGHKLPHAEPAHGSYKMPPGIYRGRMKISGLKPKNGRPPHVKLYSKQLDRTLFEQDILAPEDEPVIVEFETYLEGKITVSVENAVPGPSNAGRSGRPTNQYVFTKLNNPNSRAPWQRKMTDEEGNALYPFLIFDWLEWEGPIVSDEELARRAAFFPSNPKDLADVKASLQRFAEAAWRRPVTDEELAPYLAIVERELGAGEPTREAYKTGLLGVMASKNFFYLTEGSADQKRTELDNFELASRLSYFLWSSMPDEELLAAARSKRLGDKDELKRQLDRMLSDEKVARFCESFPRQWLQLGKVGMFPPDPKLFPDYDEWLERSMILESTNFFAEVYNKNLSIGEFLDSDWTIVNPRLAWHYEMPSLPKSGFQRVTLKPDDHRGGIMTHASVLSLTSDGTRHRPVHRGVLVSEAIFGKTPPSPPANVDPIEPNPVTAPKASVRMKLEAHAIHASCAACHRKIDPLGFAFDHYDAIGRWRTVEIVPDGKGKNPTVNATGVLPDGRAFDGPDQFKRLLRDDLDLFGEAFVETLATYALRRAMTVDDREQIRAIAAQCENDDYRLKAVIENLVTSDLFRTR